MNFCIGELKKSEKLALFLGMFAGDGCLSVCYNGEGYRIYPIRFFNTNKRIVELFSDLFSELFNVEGKIRFRDRENKKTLWEFEKYSVEIYKIINKDFEIFCGKKALNVRIPSFVRRGNKNIKKHFFLGLLITDGSIRKEGDILFHSASKQLIYDLSKLINDVWKIDKPAKHYLQQNKFNSYQLNLNKRESSIVLAQLKQMPWWHNLVLR
jgi:intein/homing endonuclease